MKAVTWQGVRQVSVEDVPDPFVEAPTDAVIRVTTTNICGSDLHLYEPMAPFMGKGNILGHENMGQVVEVGSECGDLKVGDRVAIPFQISCGNCWMCRQQLYTQCETTQVRDQGMGAALFGFSKLYGEVAGGQAEYLRVPQAQFTHIRLPEGPPDDRFAYLSDILPTAWQGVEYANVPEGGTLVVLGLGPIGDFACRIGKHKGFRVIGVDLVPERLARVKALGVEVVDLNEVENIGDAIRDMTGGRGPDSVLDAVGMEAHGSPATSFIQKAAGLLPKALSAPLMETAGVDRMNALYSAIDIVRRGGTISLSGVYGGMADPIPMLTLFDKQIQLRMGQCNIKRWVDDIMPLLGDDDPLGCDTFATHRVPLSRAPEMYEAFQEKRDGTIKVQLKPELT
ncbi:glutathione-dependent formaldehyde dehydrogenase [Blastococcus sp. CT_GayMR19]|uniref:zinc-dependent alcohol dehydrogenase n=1 Tax=Blastococcus sp. CT_GayMR19 TaxID=2559608 RepID=UPI001073F1AB|nr:zinc-dependent alcohol dehydrogenase [Blastococcus sp. CT_GayMR19]TFV74874.1 glutathione-dependent formaldehyde dehydrogenase [Blastococcus sp. CT_GayMR19]